MHLFSTPTQCTHCGTIVEDPTVERCPTCGELLKERRAPRRIAGVEKRYGSLRVVLGTLRFLGVITALVGILVMIFGLGEGGEVTPAGRALISLGVFVAAVVIFAVAAFIEVVLDVEENTRSTFRVQQQLLEQVQEREPHSHRAGPD